ncbi:forkhead box protein O [Calliphora vicina]|uniref:forkhead box protein O n=1 Tax=Calliphora vicina TaxID=7373 RepID=UPI00325A44EB
MLLYNNNNNGGSAGVANGGGVAISGGITSCNTAATLEQYRLQLYNYALNMERLRGPPYTAAAAMAAAAAYASTTTVSTTTVNGPTIHGSNYTTSGQGPPPPSSYLCATTAGNLIAATSHMGRSPAALAQCPTSNRLALASMSLFPQRIFQPEEPKPQHSYIGLIAMAILSSAETKLVLSDIYQYILDNYPYFRTRGPGWRNSIRHNLSLNDCFIKSGRSANGKGHYWAIHPANMEDFRKGDFRRRKAQRKVRKHMGLAVDDNGTDSPSPPPAMDLTSPSPPSFQHIVMGSSTITPLASAAQSFGWRFTQHHRQQPQHPQAGSHATNATAASYMGQIFTYRPQHYAAAAAAAAVLCHSGNTQHQHHQRQQLIAPNSHHHSSDTSILQPPSLLSSQSSISATNVQANVINEIFSQKRKRQFDVASLLAPDHSNKRELQMQQQQQYIRKHTSESETDDVKPSSPSNEEILDGNPATNDLDIEDIDVVDASEDEDIEADYHEHDDEVDSNNSNSHSRSHSASHCQNDDDESDCIRRFKNEHSLRLNSNHCKITEDEKLIRVHDYEPEDECDEDPNYHEGDDEHDNTNEGDESEFSGTHNNNNQEDTYLSIDNKNISNIFKDSSSIIMTHASHHHQIINTGINTSPQPAPHILDSSQSLESTNDIQHAQAHHHHHQNQSHHQLPMNADAHNLFGRYYGTYMAAAAARINSSLPSANIVGNID